MKTTPKSLRLHIGLFGRTNVGKSSFLNLVAGQDVAITSPIPGTTTDVVEKVMELLPIGPVVFLDTGGLDDVSALGNERVARSARVFDRSDVMVLIVEPDLWTGYEDKVAAEAGKRDVPLIVAVNKTDLRAPSGAFLEKIRSVTGRILLVSSAAASRRDEYVHEFKRLLIEVVPDDFINTPTIMGDLLPAGGTAVLIIPIDREAPKGRIILPQVQVIRDLLDHGAASLTVRESEYRQALGSLKRPPDIVVCDSQVVDRMVAETPACIACTTFSILFARSRGDLVEAARGAAAIRELKPGDRVLIAEACSHHAIEDDIGRVKIPRWLRKYLGFDIAIDTVAGKDFPENLRDYKLVIHCGGCMINRRLMLSRIEKAKEAGVPITNYGVCISFLQGVLGRVLSPFPAAREAFGRAAGKIPANDQI